MSMKLKRRIFFLVLCILLYTVLLQTFHNYQSAVLPDQNTALQDKYTAPPDPATDKDTPTVLWVSRLDSNEVARGFTQENLNFIVPLEKYLHIGWRSGETEVQLHENSVYLTLTADERDVLDEAFSQGEEIYRTLNDTDRKVITVLTDQPFDYYYHQRFNKYGEWLNKSRFAFNRLLLVLLYHKLINKNKFLN